MIDKNKMDILTRTSDILLPNVPLKNIINADKQLRIKYGVDVTAPFLHLGHAVNLWYMRTLQEAGHKVVFLIGDFTTAIGDPTGKSKTRPVIKQEEIEKNSEEFIRQVSTILKTDEDVFEVRRNSEWYNQMSTAEMLQIFSMVNHSTLIQRDMFQKRISEGTEIRMHEMIYPILQGYDSYELNSDLTIVGNDQLFNEKMGRFYQKKFGQNEQSIITTQITPGLDGVQKQSKSLNNYIAIADTARDKFGKTMSIPDSLIIPYLKVYTEETDEAIANIESDLKNGKNPFLAKMQLAKSLVERYHGSEEANLENSWFVERFSKKNEPKDIQEITYLMGESAFDIVKKMNESMSKGEVRRLFKQGAISVSSIKIEENMVMDEISDNQLIKIGKKQLFKLKCVNDQ